MGPAASPGSLPSAAREPPEPQPAPQVPTPPSSLRGRGREATSTREKRQDKASGPASQTPAGNPASARQVECLGPSSAFCPEPHQTRRRVTGADCRAPTLETWLQQPTVRPQHQGFNKAPAASVYLPAGAERGAWRAGIRVREGAVSGDGDIRTSAEGPRPLTCPGRTLPP